LKSLLGEESIKAGGVKVSTEKEPGREKLSQLRNVQEKKSERRKKKMKARRSR